MPTVVTKSIGSGGGRDYSTIAAWLSACPANLVTADQVWRGELYNDSEFTTTSQIAIGTGITTDATRYIELTAAAGQSFADHANVQTNALRYNQSNGVGIRSTTGYLQMVSLAAQHTRLNRIQLHQATTGGGGSQALVVPAANCRVSQCIVQGNGALGAFDHTAVGGFTAENCLFIATRSGISYATRLYDVATVTNCTIVAPSNVATKPTNAIQRNYWTSVTIKNCAIFGCTGVVSNTTNGTFTACYTDVASPPSGCTTVAYDTSTGSGFQGTTSSGLDFRLKSTSALIGAGTSSGAPAADIVGTTRPQGATYDVGAWEYVSAGVTLVVSDAAHSHTADSLVLATSVALSIAEALHNHAAEALALTVQSALAVADSAHSHAADSLTLSATATTDLVLADAAHAHAADGLTLTAASTLAPADAAHAHAADALTLSTGVGLSVAEAGHTHVADAPVLTANSALAVAESRHVHTVDNVVLEVAGTANLVIGDAVHTHTADVLALTSVHALVIADAAHAHLAEGLVLSAAAVLQLQEALHAHAAENLTLEADGAATLLLTDGLHVHTSDGLALVVDAWLAVASADHGHAADNVVFTFGGAIPTDSRPMLVLLQNSYMLVAPERSLMNVRP